MGSFEYQVQLMKLVRLPSCSTAEMPCQRVNKDRTLTVIALNLPSELKR